MTFRSTWILTRLFVVELCIVATTACGSANAPLATATPFPPKVVITTPTFTPVVAPTLFIPTFTPTTAQPLPPTVEPPPTPAPPSDEWITFVYPVTGLEFQYPANWYTLIDEARVVYVSNFRVDGPYLKWPEDEKIKIIIGLTPVDIQRYGNLQSFVNVQKQDIPVDRFVSQKEILGLPNGYQAMSQTHLCMGDWPCTIIYVAKDSSVVWLSAFDGKYKDVVQQIAGTLVIP